MTVRIVLAGGDLVLPGRVLPRGSLLLDGPRIEAIVEPSKGGATPEPSGAALVDVRNCYVLPGFVDAHVHGVEGFDTLDGGDPIAGIAARLPRYGVTAFCPTTVACGPRELARALEQVGRARAARAEGSARVLPAHLESNFINPKYQGAQPFDCLRLPPGLRDPAYERRAPLYGAPDGDFSADDILNVIASARTDVGTVTLAPELPGALALVRTLVSAGHRVSLGHSGASFDEAIEAIEAGAGFATHLFNRMTPMTHRAPGLPGAVLAREDVHAELICDGYHVHPAMCRVAIGAKGITGVMAITDGTGGSGLAPGSTAWLGGRSIRVGPRAAELEDGTLAGSTLTMDGALRMLVGIIGLPLVDAAALCSTTPARALGLTGLGLIAEGAVADIVVLDRSLRVVRTFIDGREVYVNTGAAALR
ncbi:MAG: N-acetylglucosamine-6-phosphate deacetylase [Vicinamibacterales bacterium]